MCLGPIRPHAAIMITYLLYAPGDNFRQTPEVSHHDRSCHGRHNTLHNHCPCCEATLSIDAQGEHHLSREKPARRPLLTRAQGLDKRSSNASSYSNRTRLAQRPRAIARRKISRGHERAEKIRQALHQPLDVDNRRMKGRARFCFIPSAFIFISPASSLVSDIKVMLRCHRMGRVAAVDFSPRFNAVRMRDGSTSRQRRMIQTR